MKLTKLALAFLLLGAGLLAAQSKPAKGAPAAVPDWGQYRGPNRDGHSPDTGLLKEWPKTGPTLVWTAKGLGTGYSSLSVAAKRLYTMGDVGGSCNLICLNAADGKILWMSKVGATGGNYPGPRSTPATDGTLVFALGQHGDLVCVAVATGKEVWRKNMERDFGGKVMSGWGFAESPLIDGPMLLVTPGGSKGTVLALNKMNGAPVWQSSELTDPVAYASLIPCNLGNIPQYIVYTDKSVAGIVAKTGRVAWRADRKGETAVIPTPVYKDGIVFVSSGYGVGCNAFQVGFGGGQFRASELYNGKQMTNHHGGLILEGDHVYGLGDDNKLKCIELKTGKVVWENPCVGKGSIAFADGMLYCRSENKAKGSVALVQASPEAYKEGGRFDQPSLSGFETWSHPVIFGGKLYLRDQDVLLCYDVAGGK